MGGICCCFGEANPEDTASLSRNDQLSQERSEDRSRQNRRSGGHRHREHRRQRVGVPQVVYF